MVVPTCGRPESIIRCLDALAQQSLHSFEVTVMGSESPSIVAINSLAGLRFANNKYPLLLSPEIGEGG